MIFRFCLFRLSNKSLLLIFDLLLVIFTYMIEVCKLSAEEVVSE